MKSAQMFVLAWLVLLSFTMNNSVVQASDQWISVGNMVHPRMLHTATLLQDGKVLLVGGNQQETELYDPDTRTFAVIGSTFYNHYQGATATLLNDGRVLIAGGIYAPNKAELYNPQNGTFEPTDSLHTEHSFHTATLLSDGRVLIAGGQYQVGPQTHSVCEIYDPQTGKFSLTDSLNEDCSEHSATILPNGQVLIAAGTQTTTPGSGIALRACELYNPVSGKFTRTQNMQQDRSGHQATLLNNGKVLISCGSWSQRYGELYDYQSDSWSLTGDMTELRRNYHSATLLSTGRVLLAGGYTDSATTSAELYDPVTNTFIATQSMIDARYTHVATELANGNVLVTGGYNTSGVLNKAEVCLIDTLNVGINDNQKRYRHFGKDFQLVQNYPNPFNPATMIQFHIPVVAHINLNIYNIAGEKVRTLLNRTYPAGMHAVSWDGTDDSGKQVSSGIYAYVIRSNGYQDAKRMILIR